MGVLNHVLCFGLMLLVVVHCAVLPVKKCKLEDSACMKTQFQAALPAFMAGIPELGIEVLDVMNMDDVKFDLAGLKFTLTEGKLKGLKTSVVDKVEWDVKKNQLIFDFHMPEATMEGLYTAGGTILILPITGDGQMTMKLKNVGFKIVIDYEIVKGADGKDHVKPTKLKDEYDVKNNAHFHLTGLFKGDKELSGNLLTFLNENWKKVTEEFGRPLMESASKTLFKNCKIYLEKVPLSDIALV